MNGDLLCCASKWCSTKSQPTAWQSLMVYTELEPAATMLVDCAAAPGTWPRWVIPVVGSCSSPSPNPLGNTCLCLWLDRGFNLSLMSSLVCDISQDLHINIQSDLWYIFQFCYAFYTKILQAAFYGNRRTVGRTHHCCWPALGHSDSAHSTEVLRAM